ncbi:hypothetical protein R3I94_013200 [Phoxinus phoxinus]
MEAAKLLCDSLFRWLENREECAGELSKLTQELENVPQGSNIFQAFRAVLSRSAASASVSPTPTATEAGVSSSAFNKASELIKEDEKVGTSIQKLLRDLKDRCGEALLGAHADELDCEVTSRLMWALARRSKTPVPLDFLRGFNRATFFRHMTPGGLAPAEASDFICKALGLDRSPEITSSLKVSAKEMVKNIELIGIKAVEAGSEALGATGLGISLYDLIMKSEELVKGNRVTEASEFLRDSAGEILDGQRKLKEQLDAMHEIIQKLFRMKNLIKNLGGYSLSMTEVEQRIMDYIMGTCTDNTVVSWLKGLPHNQNEFVNLLRFIQERLKHILEDLAKYSGDHIHIVFVAHGSIVDQFMPSGGLVPTPNIRDTVLYSPWNCAINPNTAFAIAQGNIQVTDRTFYTLAEDEEYHLGLYEPTDLPDHWNSMRRFLSHDIPVILLYPLTPEDEAWMLFHQLWLNRRLEIEDRVIIPYLVPEDEVKAFGEIPLYMFIFAISYILSIDDRTATVHLAACLSLKERPEEWERQYAYTSVTTGMTVNIDDSDMESELFMALRSLFDGKRR